MANFDVLDNRRPDSDVATVAHAYAAAQYRSRCNVHVIADHAVVIDLGASIDNGIIAETATQAARWFPPLSAHLRRGLVSAPTIAEG